MSITIDRKGKWQLLWGALPLPKGSEALGTITRDDGTTGALILLSTGMTVQGNAGSYYALPPLEYVCERCGHAWIPRSPSAPKVCPGCNSPYWDRPRQKK